MRRCRVCKSFRLKKVFSLGNQPLANNFINNPIENVKKYPLDLYQCRHCTLFQLGKVVKKEEMYDKYLYVPSVSKTNLEYFRNLSADLINKLNLKQGSLVVDIGSNDGSFLNYFYKAGMDIIGVEPAKNIKTKGYTINGYFNEEIAGKIVRISEKAKLVTAINVFAHIDDLQEFIRALDILLDDDGVFFAQFPDLRNLLGENQFDTIYHEHLSYFTYEPLYHLFADTPFEIWQITSDNIHGGSMQIWVRRRKDLLFNFIKNVEWNREELKNVLEANRAAGNKIVGFGAAAKGTVLLNYCGLDNSIIDYIVDGTSYKQGKFVPGVNIPIYPEHKLLNEKPGTMVLILAWNFKEEIMEKLKGRGFYFVIPIPKIRIIQC
mgnify:CR=1 FL=1